MNFIRPKRRPTKPEGDYIFTHRGKEIRVAGRYLNDPSSPDGLRWIAASHSKPILSRIVHELADGVCEIKLSPGCWKRVPYGYGTHHVVTKKMGGAFTDDRIWRDGERIRILGCPSCHRNLHNRLHWTPKASAAKAG